MRIALCTDGIFPFSLGGMQRHSRKLAEHLCRQQGVELVVLHPHHQRVFDPSLPIQEIHVAPIGEKAFYLRELWRYSSRIHGHLLALDPDVIISQGFCVWDGIGHWTDRLIVHPHGLEMFQTMTAKEQIITLPFRYFLRRIMRSSSIVISLGGRLTPIIKDQLKGTTVKVEEVPNAVEVIDVAPDYPQHQPIEMLFVGRFAFNKGIDLLIAAARHFERSGVQVKFLLAGTGPLLEQFQKQGLPGNVQLLGRVEDGELGELYARCHALVLPTRFEGMPTVVLEAMAHARPIIVSDVGATAELVDASNGYLISKGSLEALIKAIQDFCDLSTAQQGSLGRKSLEKVEQHYSWPVVSKRFRELALKIAQRQRL
jgi:glycosyltransferase involved in cell wall biosynthesis